MKIRIEIDDSLTDEEIVIRCRNLNEDIVSIQKSITDAIGTGFQLHVFKGEKEYFLNIDKILFFETDGSFIMAHTANDIYETRLRLYELEEILPGFFMRVSKSTILNTNYIHSIRKNITGASEVEFTCTKKQAFVSRSYIKQLMSKLEEKRLKR